MIVHIPVIISPRINGSGDIENESGRAIALNEIWYTPLFNQIVIQ